MFQHYIERRVGDAMAPVEAKVYEQFREMGDRAFDGLTGSDAMTVRFDQDGPTDFTRDRIHYRWDQVEGEKPEVVATDANQVSTSGDKKPFLSTLKVRAAGFLAVATEIFKTDVEQRIAEPLPSLRISYRD